MIATNGILSVALFYAAVAAVFDLRSGHIPNRLTLPALGVGAVLHVAGLSMADRAPGEPFEASLLAIYAARAGLGILSCGLVPYLLFLRDGMGGGDVKLLASLGAFLGPVEGLEVELYAFVAMALFAPARLAYEGRLFQVLGNSAALLMNPMLPKERRRTVSPELLTRLKFGPAVLVAMAVVAALRWESVG